MSMFREALRAMLLRELRCPGCGEMNKPDGKPMVDVDQTVTRARCEVCTREGPIDLFQLTKEPT